jgi:hypothetical protein
VGISKWIDKSEEQRTANIAFCTSVAEESPMGSGSLLGFGSGRSFSTFLTDVWFSFCTFHFSSYLYLAFVLGGRISNTPTKTILFR